MAKTVRGRVQGKTIELEDDLGVADGQEVEVQITFVQPGRNRAESTPPAAALAAEIPEFEPDIEEAENETEGAS